MAAEFNVRHHVDDDGRLYVELDGVIEWLQIRLAKREALRREWRANGRGDPGPLYAGDVLASLRKATRR